MPRRSVYPSVPLDFCFFENLSHYPTCQIVKIEGPSRLRPSQYRPACWIAVYCSQLCQYRTQWLNHGHWLCALGCLGWQAMSHRHSDEACTNVGASRFYPEKEDSPCGTYQVSIREKDSRKKSFSTSVTQLGSIRPVKKQIRIETVGGIRRPTWQFSSKTPKSLSKSSRYRGKDEAVLPSGRFQRV